MYTQIEANHLFSRVKMSDSVTNLRLPKFDGALGYLLQNKLPRLSEKFGQLLVEREIQNGHWWPYLKNQRV